MGKVSKQKTVIISPSGKFYGSEQTLFTFLTTTTRKYDVYVNANDGKLLEYLTRKTSHTIRPYRNVRLLFLEIFFHLFTNKYSRVYVNEAGFIRYVKVLAKLLPKKKFFVHVRLTEDTTFNRLNGITPNIFLISVSRFIAGLVKQNINISTPIISSPLRGERSDNFEEIGEIKKIGVIGRVCSTKGLAELKTLCDHLEQVKKDSKEIYLFGEVQMNDPEVSAFLEAIKNYKYVNVHLKGFEHDKKKIYGTVDVVAHFNRFEPLGVIFLEALVHGVPFIGFNEGGIGEIANNIGLESYLVSPKENWVEDFARKIEDLRNSIKIYQQAALKMYDVYSGSRYCSLLEKMIVEDEK